MDEINQLKTEVAELRSQVRAITDALISNTEAIGASLNASLSLLESLDKKAVLVSDVDVQPALIEALENQHALVVSAGSTLEHLMKLIDGEPGTHIRH